MYSQNQEEKFITEYFGDFKGTLLSIGENDGVTLSNTRKLIELGWCGIMVEPSPTAFKKLIALYGEDNPYVMCFNVAISDKVGELEFYDSGTHLGKGDTSLLSTLKVDELDRWKNTNNTFEKIKCLSWDFAKLQEEVEKSGWVTGLYNFDFINIDAEGVDWDILKQINLSGTKMLCIEWNNQIELKHTFLDYCEQFGLNKVIYENAENLIIVR